MSETWMIPFSYISWMDLHVKRGKVSLVTRSYIILSSTERDWQLQISVLTKQPVDLDKNKQAKSVLTLRVHSDTKTNVAVTQ